MSALAHPTPAPPSIPAGLLEALIDPTRTLPAIAREHGLSMADLLRFMAGPECRRELDLAFKAATERTRLVASLALPKAAESLSRLIHQIDLDAVEGRNTHQNPAQTRTPTPTPISECLRKCISLLARLTRLSIPAHLSTISRPNLPPPARSRPAPPASLSAMLSACLGSVSSQIADPDTSSGSDSPPVQSDVSSETAVSPVQSDVSRETGTPTLPSPPDARPSHTFEPTPALSARTDAPASTSSPRSQARQEALASLHALITHVRSLRPALAAPAHPP